MKTAPTLLQRVQQTVRLHPALYFLLRSAAEDDGKGASDEMHDCLLSSARIQKQARKHRISLKNLEPTRGKGRPITAEPQEEMDAAVAAEDWLKKLTAAAKARVKRK